MMDATRLIGAPRLSRLLMGTLAVAAIPLLAPPATAQLADSPWPMFHGDLRHTGRTTIVGPATNHRKWWYKGNDKIKSSPVVGPDGTVYVAIGFSLCAINPEDGSQQWCFRMIGDATQSAPAVDDDGNIYYGARDNRLYSLPPNGQVENCKYTIKNDGDVRTSPAIGPQNEIYFSGTWNGLVHAVHPDCSLKWMYKAGAGILWSSPAVKVTGGFADTVYIGDTKGNLHAINAANGTRRWIRKLTGQNRSSSPVIADNGVIYMGTTAGVSAVNPDGTLRWFFDTQGYVEATPALGHNNVIYVGTTTGRRFYAIRDDGTKATELWNIKGKEAFPTSPLIDGNGTIYTTMGKKVLALNPANGAIKWEFATGNFINSSPAIGDDGTLYVGSSDSKLHAFGH